MTLEEFKENVVGLEIDDLEGEVNVSGPWNPRFFMDLKMEVEGRKVGAHIEFVLEEDESAEDEDEVDDWDDNHCHGVVQSLECLEVYDLEGLEEDAEVSAGEMIQAEGEFFEAILDKIDYCLSDEVGKALADAAAEEQRPGA